MMALDYTFVHPATTSSTSNASAKFVMAYV